MKIENLKNKVKIILEYSKKLMGFGIIHEEDLDKIDMRIFLKDGSEVHSSQIDKISFRIKEENSGDGE